MEKILERALKNPSKLAYLKSKIVLGGEYVAFRSSDNVIALIVAFDPKVGYIVNNKIKIKMGGWVRIRQLVKSQTGIDLLEHDLEELKQKDRVDSTLMIADDKLLSKAPTLGFIECRLLGNSEDVIKASDNYTHQQTRENAYLGVGINDLIEWDIDNIIIIENFNAFCRFNEQHIKLIEGLAGLVTVVAYRGHHNRHIKLIFQAISQKNCKRYVFADYDLAGLAISESISKSIKAHGHILPKEPWKHSEKFNAMSVKDNRQNQSFIRVSLPSLSPYFEHIRDKYLAVPQETLIARRTLLTIVDA